MRLDEEEKEIMNALYCDTHRYIFFCYLIFFFFSLFPLFFPSLFPFRSFFFLFSKVLFISPIPFLFQVDITYIFSSQFHLFFHFSFSLLFLLFTRFFHPFLPVFSPFIFRFLSTVSSRFLNCCLLLLFSHFFPFSLRLFNVFFHPFLPVFFPVIHRFLSIISRFRSCNSSFSLTLFFPFSNHDASSPIFFPSSSISHVFYMSTTSNKDIYNGKYNIFLEFHKEFQTDR